MLLAALAITGHGQPTAPASAAKSSQGQPFWRGKVMENERQQHQPSTIPMNHPKSFQISRRSFLRKCGASAAATGLPLWFVEHELALAAEPVKKVVAPNDRPGIALIGCGGMGSYDALNASNFGDIVAVCDVDLNHVARAIERFTEAETELQIRSWRGKKGLSALFAGIGCRSSDGMARDGRGPRVIWEMSVKVQRLRVSR